MHGILPGCRLVVSATLKKGVESSLSYLYRISIPNCGDSMTEERKHAILIAATILLARKLMPTLEVETADASIEHYQWRAIH
jgi:hypothetical protein